MANIGYARVSTHDHDPALQLYALWAAGRAKTFEDRASGARADRPGLRHAGGAAADSGTIHALAGQEPGF